MSAMLRPLIGKLVDKVQVLVLVVSGKYNNGLLASVMFFVIGTEVSLLALSFTPAEINTTLISVVALVTALGIAMVNIIVAWRTSTKVDAVATDTAVVLGHVNSEKMSDRKTIEGLQREILLKDKMLEEKDRAAQLLAQAAAVATALAQTTATTLPNAGPVGSTPVAPLVHGVSTTDAILQQIDQNTSETAKNTARVESKIEDIAKK